MTTRENITSLAGWMLDKDYKPTNQLVKSVAGSSLKCFGDKGYPSLETLEKATMIKTAGSKVYKKDEVKLGKALLSYDRKKPN